MSGTAWLVESEVLGRKVVVWKDEEALYGMVVEAEGVQLVEAGRLMKEAEV